MTKIILFNGPPGSGKDTAAEIAWRMIPLGKGMLVTIEKFAQPVKEAVHQMLGLVGGDGKPLPHDHFESQKNDRMGLFRGYSPRASYIWYSEDVMKPRYGVDIFGQLLAAKIGPLNPDRVIFISDSGFVEEAEVIVKKYGAENVRLVRMHRTGCDFTNDSRSYLDLSHMGVKHFDIRNDGTFAELNLDISNLLYNCEIPQI